MSNWKTVVVDILTKPWFPAAAIGAGAIAGLAAEGVVYLTRKGGEPLDEDAGLFYDFPESEEIVEERKYVRIPENINEEKSISTAFKKPDIVDYTKYSKAANSDEQPTASEPAYVASVISEEEFIKASGNLDGYVTVTGTWFSKDRILAGWDENLEKKDAEDTIGRDAVKLLDDGASAVYVKNEKSKVLFEIVSSGYAYEEALPESSEE